MLKTDQEGQRQLNELFKHMTSSCFNEWEKGFIRDLIGLKYPSLSKHQKAVVTRLYGWLMGDE